MDPVEVCLTFPGTRRWRPWDGWPVDVPVTPLGGTRYRMEDLSFFVPLQFHDEFLADAHPVNARGRPVLVVQERTARSGYQRWTFVAPGGPQRAAIIEALQALELDGVVWVAEMGGLFVVNWPPGMELGAIRQRVFGGLDIV